ncbi:hypothetical protein EVC27_005 [Rhizobium phage RHph_I1_6]|uniref:Uncharacterized protein n=1 Tax=Rhizobium phage RHph_I1_6 TaxID=2509728 RepID=A0A7S5UZJ1_9CAUD|nr:hypothetical protein PP745_gp005 [Rhizobium phage RHph_I1_6]QIG76530.1 hypothetical protein EVC27_005 [Rhizobium phage RHph_I1_6]
MPRYYVLILMPLMMLCTLYFTVPMLKPVNGPGHYKLYQRQHATTVEIVINRSRMSLTECIGYQMQYPESVCVRQR